LLEEEEERRNRQEVLVVLEHREVEEMGLGQEDQTGLQIREGEEEEVETAREEVAVAELLLLDIYWSKFILYLYSKFLIVSLMVYIQAIRKILCP